MRHASILNYSLCGWFIIENSCFGQNCFFQILSCWWTMTTIQQPEMEGEEVLDLQSSTGTPSSSKSMSSSYFSVIYAPFTYPLSSHKLLPPLNSLVSIKDQVSHLTHPLAKLGHTSQIFSSAKVENMPGAPNDQERSAYSLKKTLKPPVGAVVDSLSTIRTDIVDKVSNLKSGVEDRVNAAREKVKTGVEYQVHSAREQVNTLVSGVELQVHLAKKQVNNAVDKACSVPLQVKTGVEYQVHSAREQVNTLVSGVELQVHLAKEQVNTAVDMACSVPLHCYTSSKDTATACVNLAIVTPFVKAKKQVNTAVDKACSVPLHCYTYSKDTATVYVNLAIVAPFAIYASTKESAFTFADQATIYAASFNAAQYALRVSDSGLGKTEMLLGLVPGEQVERVQMKVKKVRMTARQVRERARRRAARRNSDFDVHCPDQKELRAVSLEVIPEENATFVMVLFIMLVLLMLIVLMTLMLMLEDALENTLQEAKLGDDIVDLVGFSYILTLLSFFGISFPNFTQLVKEQESQAVVREGKGCTGN